MTKSRIYLILFIVVSTVLLYMLPRYVVNNEADEVGGDATTGSAAAQPGSEHDHDFQIPDSLAAKIDLLYVSYKNEENREKRLIFADSLARVYQKIGKLDSLAKYVEVKALELPSLENDILAGDAYYEAFNFAVDQTKRKYLGDKAQEYYKRVLDENSSLLDVKSKLAMTYVASSSPMQGITMLREVLEEDPNNELAIYNLGMLSISSGQLEKAIERFELLKQLDPDKPEAYFYIGYCLFELGKKEDSKPYFQKVLDMGISGEIVIAAEDYLKRINN